MTHAEFEDVITPWIDDDRRHHMRVYLASGHVFTVWAFEFVGKPDTTIYWFSSQKDSGVFDIAINVANVVAVSFVQ